MIVGIYDLKDPNNRDLPSQLAYERILAYNHIESVRLHADQPDFWEQVKQLDLFILRMKQYDSDLQLARDLLPVIDRQLGVKCYPNLASGWHYDDKVKQYHLLHSLGFPITESWIFYEKSRALDWLNEASFPLVFKLRGGAGSRNVLLVKSRRQARSLVNTMFEPGVFPENFFRSGSVRLKHLNPAKELRHLGGNLLRRLRGLDPSPYWQRQKNYVLFQRFLPGNTCDTRVTVIGERAFAFRRLVRDQDFRASGSGRIDYDQSKIDPRCLEIALEVSRKMGFQSMAYDFLVNERGEPEFCEVSYTYVSRAVYDCPGYWDRDLGWHEGHHWPEHLHLADALGMPDLKMPELDY